MNDSAREARNEYYRKWRQENKDRVREYNKNYWEKRSNSKEESDAENETSSACNGD